MTDKPIRLIDDVRAELSRVARADEQRGPSPHRTVGRWRGVVLAGVVGVLVAGVASAAILGAFDSRPDGLTGTAGSEVIATDTTAGGVRYQLVATRQPEGFCLTLRVTAPAAASASSSARCEGISPGGLGVSLAPVAPPTPDDAAAALPGDQLLFGTAPDPTAAATVRTPGGQTRSATVINGEDLPGKFFVVSLPPGAPRDTVVSLLDAQGRPIDQRQLAQLLQANAP